MLAVTVTAAEVIDSMVSQDLPGSAGLRITSEDAQTTGDNDSPECKLRVSVVNRPQSGDELIEGAKVFVESGTTAKLLDGMVLDAEVNDMNQVRLKLLPQRD